MLTKTTEGTFAALKISFKNIKTYNKTNVSTLAGPQDARGRAQKTEQKKNSDNKSERDGGE